MRLARGSIWVAVVLTCGACASYRPAPLPQREALSAAAQAQPWTVREVVARTLSDNPDLVAARAQKGIAAAQLLQAGLIPDPSFSGAILPLTAGPGAALAWNASLSADVRSLITLRARRAGAKAAAEQVDAEILWQEWQVASDARLLALQITGGERLLAVQRRGLELFQARDQRLRQAMAQGDVALQTAAPDIAALQAARAQVDDLERQQLARRHSLNALLGREPDAPLTLTDADEPPAPDLPSIDRLAEQTSRRRPDLVALRLGYRAQEARTREAVLLQFPALMLGVSASSDNSNVRNVGPQISGTIPLFDRNRGDIAIQRATRESLRAEYQARLDTAYGQLRAAVSELQAAQAQLARVRGDLPQATRAGERAERAHVARTIDELTYVDLANARLTKEEEIITLQQTVIEQAAIIDALTGAGLPPVDNLPDLAL
jgi:outer membrane protein TolC